jgi:hypothetical protein
MVFQFLIKSKTVSPDFLIFYETSERFLSGENVYFSKDGDIGYAPTLLYFLLSPLTLLDRQIASNLFIVINYVIILLIIFLLSRFFSMKHLLVVLTVLNASFSVRSVINNGQIGIIVLLMQLFFLIVADKKSTKDLLLKSAILFLMLSLKPYLILPYFIYLIILRKKEVFIAASYALLFEVIYFLINPTSTIFNYLQLIFKRSQGTKKEIDQSSLLSLVNGNKIIFTIYLILILIFTYRNFPKIEQNRIAALFILAPLISIYFHRQDSVFAILIFALLLINRDHHFIGVLILLLFHTGTFNIYFLLQLLFMLFVLMLLIHLRKKVVLSVAAGLVAYSFIINFINTNFGYEAAYQLWTPLVFAFQILVYIYYLKSNKNRNIFVSFENKSSRQ